MILEATTYPAFMSKQITKSADKGGRWLVLLCRPAAVSTLSGPIELSAGALSNCQMRRQATTLDLACFDPGDSLYSPRSDLVEQRARGS